MNKTIKFLVNKSNDGKVDIFLSDNLNLYTRSHIKRLIDKENLKLMVNTYLNLQQD